MANTPELRIKPFAPDLYKCLEELSAGGDEAARALLINYHLHHRTFMQGKQGGDITVRTSRVGTGDESYQRVNTKKRL